MVPQDTSTSKPQINIYLTPIHRCGNKREDERATLIKLLKNRRIKLLPNDISVIHSKEGAPRFSKEIGLSISISHSDHILAVAIYPDKYRVGIDIEERAEKAAQLISRVASEDELSLLKSQGLQPIILWSAKEAVFKAFSDKIGTMSEQVVLKDCHPLQKQLTMIVLEDNGRLSTSEVTYINYLEKNIENINTTPLPYPFVLSFASNMPDIRYQLVYLI